MRLVVLISLVLFVSCSSMSGRMPISEDISYEPWMSQEAIGAVRFPSSKSGGDIQACIAQVVTNRSVTLGDSSGSFVGAYTGKYYSVEHTRETGGGDVILHASDRAVVAQGVTQYNTGAFVGRALRYTVTITDGGYEFANIEQAITDSGAAKKHRIRPSGRVAGRGARPCGGVSQESCRKD